MDARTKLAKNVRRLRKEGGYTQEAFADHANLHRNYCSDIERGIRNPTVTVLEKLATALNVSIGTLFE